MESSTTTTEHQHDGPMTLQFVTYPSGSAPEPSRELRAAVRAHVSRRQHRQKRQGDPFRPMVIGNEAPQTSSFSATKTTPSSRSKPRANRSAKRSTAEGNQLKTETSSASSSTSPSHSPSISPSLGSMQEDPFWTFPIDYSPLFPRMISHYIHNLALPVTELDGPTQKGLLRTHWFPMAMMSSATMYSLLLMAASHYYSLFGPQGVKSGDENTTSMEVQHQTILVLKARALDEVNKCLNSDDLRVAVGDTTIGAVAKLAAFEAVFGDEVAYQQHMSGLIQMLQIRATLGSAIGPLDQFLERLVAWIDINAAHFTSMPERSVLGLDVEIDEPNPLVFAGTELTRAELQMGVNC